MWVNISAKAKTIVLPHKIEVEILHKFYLAHISTIIAENTENLPNSSSYMIEHKIVRNSHLLLCKIGIISKCHSNCSTNKCKLLIRKIIKAAIDCSYVYCEGRYGKVLQTCVFLFKCTTVFTGIKKSIGIIA